MIKHPPIAWMSWAWPKVALPEYPRDRRTVAYHEAGHAVLSHILRLPMTGARVHDAPPGATPGGSVDLDLPAIKASAAETIDTEIPQSLHELVAIELATMYVAGIMAELKLHGLEVTGWLGLEDRDFLNARILLCEAFGIDLALYYCQCLASAVLAEHWSWVAVVAGEIEANGSVTVEDIARAARSAVRLETASSTRTDASQGAET